ncbi:MAG: glycosyltransferase, partial [Ruegeria sp.]
MSGWSGFNMGSSKGPAIAIFTPVLNGADHIGFALKSVAEQSYQNWTHYILDAESSDGTSDIVARHAAHDERIIHLRQADQGQYDALLSAIPQKPADIVGWLNADDLLPSWSLTAVARIFDRNPDWSWISGLPALWGPDLELRTIFPRTYYRQSWIARGWYHDKFLGSLQQESIFFRASLMDKLPPETIAHIRSLKLAGDFALWREFAKHAPLHGVPTILGGFRPHGDNRSITAKSDYVSELKSIGAPFPPPFFANVFRRIYDAGCAYLHLRA